MASVIHLSFLCSKLKPLFPSSSAAVFDGCFLAFLALDSSRALPPEKNKKRRKVLSA